jgi:hypothetical protein
LSYCNAVWRRRFIDASGNTYPCCHFDRRTKYDADTVKKQMLNNELVKGCDRCNTQAKLGEKSQRQQYNSLYGYTEEDIIYDVEIGVDNICNLQCLTCSSSSSHKWFDIEKKHFGVTIAPQKYQSHTKYTDIDWSKVKSLHLYGGEPFYSPNVEEMFDYIIDKVNWTNFRLTGSTNCTRMPKDSVLDKIKQCKEFTFNLSIDAYGKLNEYTRAGSKWNDVVSTMKKWHDLTVEYSNIKIIVFSTVSIYTANKYHSLVDFVKQEFPNFSLELQCLQVPNMLSIVNTPTDYKEFVQSETDNMYILQFMNNKGEDLFEEFVYYTKTMGLDGLQEANPELYTFIKAHDTSKDFKQKFVNMINEYKI